MPLWRAHLVVVPLHVALGVLIAHDHEALVPLEQVQPGEAGEVAEHGHVERDERPVARRACKG